MYRLLSTDALRVRACERGEGEGGGAGFKEDPLSSSAGGWVATTRLVGTVGSKVGQVQKRGPSAPRRAAT